MQNDLPHQTDAPSSHPDPASPSFPSLHRHHQPTQPAEPYRDTSPSGSSLRRRRLPRDGDVIRIDIRTPFENGVSGTKEGIPVHRSTTVRELKDGIADGQYGEGAFWIREGMRIVWQGRIVRDEEVIGDVVANSRNVDSVYTLHLVARRLGGTPAVPHLASGYFPQAPAIPEAAVPPPTIVHPPTIQRSQSHPESQPLLDSIHYLLFTARHHLFCLLGREPLKWGDTIPPPVVNAAVAREAIMSVMRTIVDARPVEERAAWVDWEQAFEADDEADIRKVWEASSRQAIEEDIRRIWLGRVGRPWSDSPDGQMVEVEIDHIVHQLHLPQLDFLTATQLIHLRVHLNITTLLPLLYPFLPTPTSSTPDRFTPTPTTPLPPPRPTFRSALARLPRIPMPVLNHMFFMAFKLIAMLWMMTQGMPWSDGRLWILGGAATGWWLADGWQRYNRERPRPPPVQPVEAGPGPEPAGAAMPGQEGINPANVIHQAIPTPSRTRLAPHLAIPLVHLSTDAAQLRLISDSINPTRQVELARTPSQPARPPSRIITQFLLPIGLWFITLIPEFEAMRTRTIRRRERAMRVLVGELNVPAPAAAPAPAPASGAEATEVEGGDDAAAAPAAAEPAELILPSGLNEVARKYYLRTMERGEGIDWEEEREAQRAMGVGREEEEEGAGGFIGMF